MLAFIRNVSCTLCALLSLCYSLNCVSLEAPYAVTGAKTVSAREALSLYESGAVFIDVRDRDEWAIGHIHGAIHLDFKRDFEKLYYANGQTKGLPIVIYCNGENCLRSAYASAISVLWGYSQVYYFRSGYFAWMLADYPLVLSSNIKR